jgi:hypothetical protein
VWDIGGGEKYISVGNSEKNKPLVGPRYRWVGNIKININKLGCDNVDWIHLI